MAATAAKSASGLIYHQTRKNLMIGEHTKLIIQVNKTFNVKNYNNLLIFNLKSPLNTISHA